MARIVKMVVVNGVRYREEDAPEATTSTKQAEPKNKSRKPGDKSDAGSEK